MNQKQVKIIGISLNHSLGIVNACKLVFDQNNKLIPFLGEVGSGKTTLQKGIQLGTQGAKTLTDNNLFGPIDLEVQLLDGDLPLWVGCRNKGKKVIHTLYTKDTSGKKVKDPIIDGVKATPAKYFETLQTALTWRMDELTSENPAVQKKILLQLYQAQLKLIGVIFDKKHPDYSGTILGKIDAAVKNRDEKDYLRKTKGGIADDLKAQGVDPDRPDTCPDSVNIEEIEAKIKEIEKERTLATAEPEAQKKTDLAEIKADAAGITNKCLAYNSGLKEAYEVDLDLYCDYDVQVQDIKNDILALKILLEKLNLESEFGKLENRVMFPKAMKEPTKPNYIHFENGQASASTNLDEKADSLLKELDVLRAKYIDVSNKDSDIDISSFDLQLEILEQGKKQAHEINKIVAAIDSFHQWRAANEDVARLKDEYVKLLAQIDTGVEGLAIKSVEDDIFLMYNGAYDTKYFNNPNNDMRKLSSYSGTQKPVICLLIQNYLLSKKPKAMRYMYIDNIPIDNKTRELLERMTEELNLSIFLNITGDFEQKNLQDGEILIEGGEVFFNN